MWRLVIVDELRCGGVEVQRRHFFPWRGCIIVARISFFVLPLLVAIKCTSADDVEDTFRSPKSCGLNCAYVFLKTFGRDVEYDQLKTEAVISDRGMSLSDLAELVGRHGVSVRMLQASPDDLLNLPLPIIAHEEPEELGTVDSLPAGHYSVVLGIEPDGNRVTILDGTTGAVRQVDLSQFTARWSGFVIARKDLSYRWAALLFFAAGIAVALVIRKLAIRRQLFSEIDSNE